MKVEITKKADCPRTLFHVKQMQIREKLLSWIFGKKHRVIMLVPDEGIQAIEIKGGESLGRA